MTNELWATLIGAVVLLLTNLAASVKVWTDNVKIKSDRVESKRGITERFAIIEERLKSHDKRLDDGDSAFRNFDTKLDRNNELLNQLIGEVRAGRK